MRLLKSLFIFDATAKSFLCFSAALSIDYLSACVVWYLFFGFPIKDV